MAVALQGGDDGRNGRLGVEIVPPVFGHTRPGGGILLQICQNRNAHDASLRHVKRVLTCFFPTGTFSRTLNCSATAGNGTVVGGTSSSAGVIWKITLQMRGPAPPTVEQDDSLPAGR